MSLNAYARQNVDHSVRDARVQNPYLKASDVYRRISVAHNLSGATMPMPASSYCTLAASECQNNGGTYAYADTSCGMHVAVGTQSRMSMSAPGPAFGPAPMTQHQGSSTQWAPVTPGSQEVYDSYWRGGARTNIDPVSESRCILPTFMSPTTNAATTSSSSSSSSSLASYFAGSTVDQACFAACMPFVGQQHGSGACANLCALQVGDPSESAGPYPVDVYAAQPRFDQNLPLTVGIGACLRQCDEAPLPGQQQACRLGCIAQTNAPSVFNSATGPCMLGCLTTCNGSGAPDCQVQCLRACTGNQKQTAFAVPTSPIQLGL